MQLAQDTLSQLQALLKTIPPDVLAKATYGQPGSATTGINFYDLEPQVKLTVPEITPLIQMIPRVKAPGGTATHWRAVTGINTSNLDLGVADGVRAGVMATTTQDNEAPYATLGLEASATWESEWAAQGFSDIRALAVLGLLKSARIGEERLTVGGNRSVALGTPVPAFTGAITGGLLVGTGSVVYHCRVVALTLSAYMRASTTLGIPTTRAVVSADGGTTTTIGGGASLVSADATATVASGTTGSIVGTVTAIPGAVAYAWFISVAAGSAGGERLAAITTVNAYTFTAVPSAGSPGTGFATDISTNFNVDHSTNSLVFDGLISICGKSGSNALFASSDNAVLTSDSAGGITEINTDLRSFWDNYRLSPDAILMNAQELINISNKVISGGGTPLFRFAMDGNGGSTATQTVTAGTVVGFYMNKTAQGGGKLLRVILHPDVPPGTIIYFTETIPYSTSNFTNILQFKAVKEWHQIEWPMRTRAYEYGVYVNEVLQCYFPPAFGMRCNIKNG